MDFCNGIEIFLSSLMSQNIQLEFTRSGAYWYPDGNIVLQVENTQFRVHLSLLAKQLPVFADAFAFQQGSENVEGCPVVTLPGDRTEDWDNLLMTMYSPFTIYPSTMDYPIPIILSTLRLADKYEADHLRDMAATRLRNNIPNDVDETAILLNTNPRLAPSFIEHIFDILDTALDLGIQTIVPTACLICMTYMGHEKILSGHTRIDGSIASLSPTTSKMLIRGWQSMMVSAIDLTVNRPMKHEITRYCKKEFSVDISPRDTEVYQCGAKARMKEHILRIGRVVENPANALTLGSINLCKVCADPIDEEFEKARDEIWDELPSFFNLPAWDQLKDFGQIMHSPGPVIDD